MIKWGQKSNPKKFLNQNLTPQKSHAEFPSHKNFQRNYAAGMRGNYHEASDCFEYQKKSLLKSSYPKNTCRNFPNQKNPQIVNFKPQKILRSSLSLEIRSTRPHRPLVCLQPSEFPSQPLQSRHATLLLCFGEAPCEKRL